jgi:long-chain acyl-CoA synthetase
MSEIAYFAWDLTSRGNQPCVRDENGELSYREFAERVDALAAQLASTGIGREDVVAVSMSNRVELLVTLMAAWRVGASATPINPAFSNDEAQYQITDSGAALIVTDNSRLTGSDAVLRVDQIRKTAPTGWRPVYTPGASDVALLIYTSGSTGRPKGVELTHANLQHMAQSLAEHMSLSAADHCLLILPLFHVNAICASFLAPILAGGQLSVTGKFSVSRFYGDISKLRPTYFSAVPTIYAMLISRKPDEPADLSSLRFAVCGAAPISRELLAAAEKELKVPIIEGYGLTEGTCASACNPPNGLRKPGTVGPPLPGQRIAIADPDGRHLPAGQPGEVLISGPTVMRGYLNQPEATARTVVGGWLHTGDVGRLDAHGYLTLVDRIKDLIIRGGENIYPKEIENALATHPAVLESAVVGAPDELYGEVPIAFVVCYPERPTTGDELIEHMSGRLAQIKLPAAVHIVDSLPRNPVGKIDKPTLRRTVRSLPTVHR